MVWHIIKDTRVPARRINKRGEPWLQHDDRRDQNRAQEGGRVSGVKTVKLFEVELDAPADKAQAEAEEMCRKLLANPVIQNYRVTVR